MGCDGLHDNRGDPLSSRWLIAACGNVTHFITVMKYKVLYACAIIVIVAIEFGIYSIYHLAVNSFM